MVWIVRHREKGAKRWTFVGVSGCVTQRADARRFASEAAARAYVALAEDATPGWEFGALAVKE